MSRLCAFFAVIAALVSIMARFTAYAGEEATLKITTKLGVSKEITVIGFDVDDYFLYHALGASRPCIPLALDGGAIVALWLGEVRGVEVKEDTMTVVLQNGESLSGKPLGSFSTDDRKKYSMNSVTHVSVVRAPKKDSVYHPTEVTKPSEQTWALRVGAVKSPVLIRNPRIAHAYRFTNGFGGGSHLTSSSSFALIVEKDRIQADVVDFTTFAALKDGQAQVMSSSGVKTRGKLAFEDSPFAWGLHGGLHGTDASVVAVTGASFSIKAEATK
jgi:hypothetical protein